MFTNFAWLSTRRVCAVVGLLAGCFQPSHSIDEAGDGVTPPTDRFAPDASTTAACQQTDPSPLSALHIGVRTSAPGGRFAPRNVGAIWIERADGTFVKTVARWGMIRARWLLRFAAASQQNLADAVTGATLISHETHDVTWDLKDRERCEIAAGDYQVLFEVTDKNGAGPTLAIPFSKDQAPLSLAPTDELAFHDITIDLQ
jgi:hypothetical protein